MMIDHIAGMVEAKNPVNLRVFWLNVDVVLGKETANEQGDDKIDKGYHSKGFQVKCNRYRVLSGLASSPEEALRFRRVERDHGRKKVDVVDGIPQMKDSILMPSWR